MSIFQKSRPPSVSATHFSGEAGAEAVTADVQAAPVMIAPEGEVEFVTLKVDLAFRLNSSIVVAGWRTRPVQLHIRTDVGELPTRVFMTARPDVADHLVLASGNDLGFVLLAEIPDELSAESSVLRLAIDGHPSDGYALQVSTRSSLNTADLSLAQPALAALCETLTPHTESWMAIVAAMETTAPAHGSVRGQLDSAVACPHTRNGIASGWVVKSPDTSAVWLEDEEGRMHDMRQSFWRQRPDVYAALAAAELPAGMAQCAGFVTRLEDVSPWKVLKLKALAGGAVTELGEVRLGGMAQDPVAAARLLFSLVPDTTRFTEYLELVAQPVLESLLDKARSEWAGLPVSLSTHGSVPASPMASIIVPLYGRMDFVEHQLIEFSKDPWFAENGELIYVLDDPGLEEQFAARAEILHRLYRVPFRWVWGGANRGFSGANNLGAAHSAGEHLVFLNSDAFPQQPGWLQTVVGVLQARPEVGAVGVRLVFPDGSIQHAGMTFVRRKDLGVWVNHHPCMGLDAALDPNASTSEVPAVTGACLAMRRDTFDRVGGWDTGYLIGDFEDSDLCLKLRSDDMTVVYEPSVQLTHLERQSFKLLGSGEFRTRVTILNALRHQQRWGGLIEELSRG